MKASATHFDRAAIRIRAQLITARTAMINQLRALLKLCGHQLGSARAPGKRTDRLAMLYSQRPDLEALFTPPLASIDAIEEQLRTSNSVALLSDLIPPPESERPARELLTQALRFDKHSARRRQP